MWKWDKTKTTFTPKSKKFKDITGIKFGKLIALYPSHVFNKRTYWVCECECGNECIIGSAHLPSGAIKSCGCAKIESHKELTKRKFKGVEDLSSTYFSQIQRSAKNRNLEITITKQYIWELFVKQNKKCALSGEPITLIKGKNTTLQSASLDRIDSSKGYVEGNVQWVHKVVNILKNNLSDNDFINWCCLIVKNSIGDLNEYTVYSKGIARIR